MDVTERQNREMTFYEAFYAKDDGLLDVNFDPIADNQKRPWNSYWKLFSSIKNTFLAGMILLDYGCGNGENSILFAKIGYHVTGFDISEQGICAARHLATKYGFENNISFETMVAEKLALPDSYFDVIAGIDIYIT
ncbi:MAG: class I SAM-dependent methyltransferase, partial [Burkholderiales bacterium]